MACFGIQKICQADCGGLGGECRHIQPLRSDSAAGLDGIRWQGPARWTCRQSFLLDLSRVQAPARRFRRDRLGWAHCDGRDSDRIIPLRPQTASKRLDFARRRAARACQLVPGRVRIRRRSNSVLSRLGRAGRSRPPQGLLASRSIGRRSKDSEPESKTVRSRLWSCCESGRMRRLAFSGAMEGVPWRVLLSSHALSLDAYCRERSGRSVPTINAAITPLLIQSGCRSLWRYIDTVSPWKGKGRTREYLERRPRECACSTDRWMRGSRLSDSVTRLRCRLTQPVG